MIATDITPAQLQRLQILYAQFERHSLDCPGAERVTRLEWASAQCGRTIGSFKHLTLVEAKRLIDQLQGTLGVKAPNKSPRKRPTRHQAEKLGTEGRNDQKHNEVTLVSPAQFDMIRRDLDRLGWSNERLEAFLASSRGPLRGKTQIRTLGDANKVHWALKHIKPDSERKTA